MAEFNEEQKNFYNSLISQDIDADTANKLTTGELSAADYKASLEKTKTNSQEEMFEAEGYDVKLMTETKAKIAKKTKQAAEGAAADDISQESIYLAFVYWDMLLLPLHSPRKDLSNELGFRVLKHSEIYMF